VGVAIFGLIAALAQQESDMKSAYITATKDTLRKAGSHLSGIARTDSVANGHSGTG
jgi:hypothetical protein